MLRPISCLLAMAATFLTVAAGERPNVLLICVDDLKPLLGCYGDPLAKTPAIDKLAARSVMFERAYCNQAICSPSRNALMTGLRPQTLGIYDLPTNFRSVVPNAVTLPQVFIQNGYKAEALGKIYHHGHGNFDDRASWSVPWWISGAAPYALKESAPPGANPGAPSEAADVPDDTYPDGLSAAEAIRRLQAAKQDPNTPFFLAVGFIKPHLPFVAPKKYWDLYDPAKITLAPLRSAPAGSPGYAPGNSGELRKYLGMPASGALSDDLQRHLIHGYYAATSYADAQIGRILDELDRLGLAQNTLVILWGDHGWHLGDHGLWCKHTNYEEAARIPLLISAPGGKAMAGSRTTSLVETVDIYPTICELAGLSAPAGLDGRSFAAALADPSKPARDHVIHVYPRNRPGSGEVIGRAIRTERYRMVEWKKPGADPATAEFELFDYQSDPLEKRNLAGEQPEVLTKLRALLATHPEAKPQYKGPRLAEPKGAGVANDAAKPATDRNALFNRRDSNKDAKLSPEEFAKGQPDPEAVPARFKRFDVDADGFLLRDEFVHPPGAPEKSAADSAE
jgi:iduronate 2-sulfatase